LEHLYKKRIFWKTGEMDKYLSVVKYFCQKFFSGFLLRSTCPRQNRVKCLSKVNPTSEINLSKNNIQKQSSDKEQK